MLPKYKRVPKMSDLEELMSANYVRAKYNFEAAKRGNDGHLYRVKVGRNTILKIVDSYIESKTSLVRAYVTEHHFHMEAKSLKGITIQFCDPWELGQITHNTFKQIHVCNLFEVIDYRPDTKGQLRFKFHR
ncbi:hypothetical protein HY450_01920 [Candidatus Pacearchaeota archaeon]|nr:hypothetical protein [Candidatus Pacearchaeota archaeon]